MWDQVRADAFIYPPPPSGQTRIRETWPLTSQGRSTNNQRLLLLTTARVAPPRKFGSPGKRKGRLWREVRTRSLEELQRPRGQVSWYSRFFSALFLSLYIKACTGHFLNLWSGWWWWGWGWGWGWVVLMGGISVLPAASGRPPRTPS